MSPDSNLPPNTNPIQAQPKIVNPGSQTSASNQWGIYQPPKNTANRFVGVGDLLDDETARRAALSGSTGELLSTPTQLALPAKKSLLKQIAFSLGVVAAIAVIGIIASLRQSATNKASLSSQTNQKTGASSILDSSFDTATLKINRDTVVGGGKGLSVYGTVAIQNEANSVNAFSIQNSQGGNLLVADTKDNKIAINGKPVGTAALQVNGDISTNGSLITPNATFDAEGLHIGNSLVCTARGCISSSSPSPTPTNPTIDVASLAYINKNQTYAGQITIKNSAAAGFQVQTSAGSSLLSIDTQNARVGINITPVAGGANLQVGGNVNISGLYQVAGNSGSSLACGAGEILQQQTVQGGITTGGSCTVIAGATTPTLQQVYNASGSGTIGLTSAIGPINIQDNSTPLGSNLFAVKSSGGTVYFAASATGASVTGNINTTGQYQVGGSQISSANLSNDSNLAKLGSNQTFTGNNTFSSASNSFTGSGSGLTGLSASNVSSGTLNDTRLSNNVALLSANNQFSGNNIFVLNTSAMSVQDASSPLGANLFQVTNNNGSTKYFTVSATQLQFNGQDVCTASGNCAGVGGGVTTTGGTPNKLAKFTAGQAVGDSIITDNGSTVTIGGTLAVNTLSPTAALTVGVSGQGLTLQGDGTTSLKATTGGITNSLVFAAPSATNKTITIPNASGTVAVSSSGPLSLDAAGNLTCPTCLTSGGGGGSAGVSSFNTLTGAVTLQGTTNQISLSTVGNTLTLSTPQDIATSSTPTFANLNVGSGGELRINSSSINTAGTLSNVAYLNQNQIFTGNNTIKSTAAAAFQVQNAGATDTLLTVDSSVRSISGGNIVKIGNSTGTDTNTTILVLDGASANPTSNLSALSGGLFYNSNTGKISLIENGVVKVICNQTDASCGGNSTTLQQAYNSSTTAPQITLNSSPGAGGLVIADNASPLGTDLFDITNNGGSTKFFSVSATGAKIGTNDVCTTAGNCAGAGSGVTTAGGTAGKIAKFSGTQAVADSIITDNGTNISVAGNINTTGQYQVGGTQISSANLSNDSSLAKTGSSNTFSAANTFTGSVLAKSTSTTAFQLQNATGGSTLIYGDTQNMRLGIGQASASYTLDVGGDVNTSTGFRVGGTSGAGVTCSSGNVLSNIVVTGGIVTGGSCAVNGAGISPTLQNVYDNSGSPATITTSSSTKGVLIKAGSGNDSATLFQIQNAASASLINVDSVNSIIALAGNNSGALGPWSTSANNLPAARSSATSVTANGYVYEIGGAGPVSTVYYAKLNADGSTGAWSTNSNALPTQRSYASSITANGYIYVIGGWDGLTGAQTTVYYAKLNADGSTGAWSTSANGLPSGREWHSSVTANGYVYVVGGYNSSTQTTVYYAKLNADGSTGAWSTNSNALPAPRDELTSIVANGYLYAIGGESSNGGSSVSTVYYAKLNADGSTGAWSTNSNALPANNSYATSSVSNGYAYVLGGYNGSSNQSTIYYAKLSADGSTGAWSTNSNALPSALSAATSVTSNGYIYEIGGSGVGTTIYYASTARLQIGANIDLVGLQGGNISDADGLSQGSVGGSITAGNITAVGALQVQGQASFAQGLQAAGNLTIGGSALFQNSTNSSIAFQVQNATGGNLIGVDSVNSVITLAGNNSGSLSSWQTNVNNLPTARMNAATSSSNGYIYELGGYNSGAQTTVYYSKINADGTAGSWSTNSNALPVGTYNASSVTSNGYIYIIGGCAPNCGAISPTIYYAKLNADGSTGTWTTNTNNLPNGRYGQSSVVSNGYLYVVGGVGAPAGSGGNSTVYYTKLNADGSTAAWQTNANALPTNNANTGPAVALNGYMYLIGGCVSGTCGAGNNTVYYAKLNADGSTGTWTTSANTLPANRFFGASIAIGDYMYMIGGYPTTSGTAPATIYYAKGNADGTTGAWAADGNSLPTGKGAATVAAVNGSIYIIGGANDYVTTPTNTIYYASTSRIKVGANLDLISLQGGDGSGGGSITAANITGAGDLQVQGQGNFAQSVGIGGNLSVAGQATIQNSTNSTTAFQVQNSSGQSLINVDTVNSNLTLAGLNSGALRSWTTSANSLPVTLNNHTTVTANGYVYAMGGFNGTSVQATVYYAKLNSDGTTGTWSTNANSVPTAMNWSTAVTTGGYIYVLGGLNGGEQSFVYYSKINADGSTGTWQTNTNALTQPLQHATSVVANGYVYVMGGTDGTAQSTVYYAKINPDGSLASWTTSANPLPAATSAASSVVANGYVYVMGGSSSSVYYAKLNTNGSTGSWTTSGNSLPGSSGGATAQVSNGYVYFIGGAGSSDVSYAKLNTNGSINAWTTNTNPIPQVSWYAGSAVVNGYVYVIGGHDGSTGRSTVYISSTSRIQLGSNLDLVGLQGGNLSEDGGLGGGSSGGSITAGNITAVGGLQVQGASNFMQGASITGNLSITSASGALLFAANPNNMTITLGAPSATPVLLVLGNKNTSGDPTCTDGALYYNSNTSQFRGCWNGSWSSFASVPGYTSSLPGSPVDGQEVYYQADATNGIIWHLRYNAGSASSYKWEYLGGGDLTGFISSSETPGSTSTWVNLATDGPSITVPRSGEYLVTFSTSFDTGVASRMTVGLAVGNNTPPTPWADTANDLAAGVAVNRQTVGPYKVTFSASDVAKLRYDSSNSTNVHFSNRMLTLTPVRIN